MEFLQSLIVLLVVLTLYGAYRQWTRFSIADIPGPEPESFLLGCLPEYFQNEAGVADFKWHSQFGNIIRMQSALGNNRLMVSDPAALHHIFNSGYNIRKQPFRLEIVRAVTGPGLASVDSEVHRRQRKINSPAFGTNDARSYIPIFSAYAHKLSTVWKESLPESGSMMVNASSYFARFFLDVIGEVAFDYRFGTTDDDNDPLSAAFSSITPKMYTRPSKIAIFIFGLLELIPVRLIRLFMQHAPASGLRNSRRVSKLVIGVAKKLVDEKAEALVAGKGKRDIFSLLVKANASANPRTCLSETEMLAQMQTIMGAGHETTANTMSWTLFELAKNLAIQTKLRAEIQEAERAMRARGDTEFTYVDFDAMKYTTAVMKETLRYYPVVHGLMREAARDEILPLSTPIVTRSGKTITEIPIAKNQVILVSVAAYNRNKEVFGPDADVYNPDRWLNGSVNVTTPLGVYGNLMTFGSGHRACIGWRFAVYEYQTFLVELVKNFSFSIDPTLVSKVRRESALIMLPTISGEEEKGAQLPIIIRAVETL